MSRSSFQWKYVDAAPQDTTNPQILNVGSCDDPLHIGGIAMHVDIDDWRAACRHFTQADAAKLPFEDQSYHTVILGDMLEHVVDPMKVVSEAARVTKIGGVLVLTVFEEWRLPGYGQFIEEARRLSDIASQALGYADSIDYQDKKCPQKIGYPEEKMPHLFHINQFSDEDMQNLGSYVLSLGFETIESVKAPEQVQDGHTWYNWLFAFRRVS